MIDYQLLKSKMDLIISAMDYLRLNLKKMLSNKDGKNEEKEEENDDKPKKGFKKIKKVVQTKISIISI